MNYRKYFTGSILMLLAMVALLVSFGSGTALAQKLYIGDNGDFPNNTVKAVDLNITSHTGVVSTFVANNPAEGPFGARGVLFQGGNFLVANQNVGTPNAGDVLSYNGVTGAFQKELVPNSSPNAPWAPRGMILGKDGKSLYVANIQVNDTSDPGTVKVYNTLTGNFIKNISSPASFPSDQFHPRGVVFGPDDLLYVSSRTLNNPSDDGGWVLRFNADGSFHDVFINDTGGLGKLNSPEGLVFGPDKNLYITSLVSLDSNGVPITPGETNSIRIYNSAGTFLNAIDLGQNARALALLFGPDGNLFVPISTTGELRSFDIYKNYKEADYSLSGESLISPWYLTFQNTDPHTLNYAATPLPPLPYSLAPPYWVYLVLEEDTN